MIPTLFWSETAAGDEFVKETEKLLESWCLGEEDWPKNWHQEWPEYFSPNSQVGSDAQRNESRKRSYCIDEVRALMVRFPGLTRDEQSRLLFDYCMTSPGGYTSKERLWDHDKPQPQARLDRCGVKVRMFLYDFPQ